MSSPLKFYKQPGFHNHTISMNRKSYFFNPESIFFIQINNGKDFWDKIGASVYFSPLEKGACRIDTEVFDTYEELYAHIQEHFGLELDKSTLELVKEDKE